MYAHLDYKFTIKHNTNKKLNKYRLHTPNQI